MASHGPPPPKPPETPVPNAGTATPRAVANKPTDDAAATSGDPLADAKSGIGNSGSVLQDGTGTQQKRSAAPGTAVAALNGGLSSSSVITG